MAFVTQSVVTANCERCGFTQNYDSQDQAARAGWRKVHIEGESPSPLVCPRCVKELRIWFQNKRPPTGEAINGVPGAAKPTS
jgi:hypothetical protein